MTLLELSPISISEAISFFGVPLAFVTDRLSDPSVDSLVDPIWIVVDHFLSARSLAAVICFSYEGLVGQVTLLGKPL